MPRPAPPARFDWEALKLSFGIGIPMLGIAALIYYAVRTAPAGAKVSSAARGIGALMPATARDWLATGLAGAFALFGAFLILMGIREVLAFLFRRRPSA